MNKRFYQKPREKDILIKIKKINKERERRILKRVNGKISSPLFQPQVVIYKIQYLYVTVMTSTYIRFASFPTITLFPSIARQG